MTNEFGPIIWEGSGAYGRAWQYEYHPQIPDQQATLAVYELIAEPPQHPAWNRYALSSVHLRPIEGCQPANITTPDATHEVMVLALDPKFPEQFGNQIKYLMPPNIVAQVQVPLDDNERADEVMRNVLRMVAEGFVKGYPVVEDGGRRLSQHWQDMLDATIEHEIHGHH